MKKFPWRGLSIGCGVLALLVLGRCVATFAMTNYYGGNWLRKILDDPWFYVGLTALPVGFIAHLTWKSDTK